MIQRHLRAGRPRLLLLVALAAGLWLARPSAQPAAASRALAEMGAAASTAGACAAPANPIVAENCRPGSEAWKIQDLSNSLGQPAAYPIEGFASAASVSAGDDLSFYVNTNAPSFDLLIFRSGYYGGTGGRLVAEARGLAGRVQPACRSDPATGLLSCGNWSTSYQLAVPGDWVSGVYLAKLARSDGRAENEIVFVVRDDRRPAPVLVQMGVSTYQAYNAYGGKSVYSFNSTNVCATISGAPRAVAVAFDRPLAVPAQDFPNTYFYADYPMVFWLEAQGYDLGYAADVDVDRWGRPGEHNGLLDHRVFLAVGHDEYWSAERRAAVSAARDAGVSLGFFSSNTSYWRARYAPDPWTGEPDRVLVTYKTTESGDPDPSGQPTGTWRDPLGAKQPENALVGVQYAGENGNQNFPLRVSQQQAQDRLYRHTGLESMPPGSFVDIGKNLVGWEWDATADNGHSPAGLTVLAESPVLGMVLADAGRHSNLGAARAQATRYTAASGAIVFASGTNLWSWGLAVREPDARLQQMTYNLLADMGAQPATPAGTLVLDATGGQEQTQPVVTAPSGGAAPQIGNLEARPSDSGVSIRWTTDVPAAGQVWIKQAPGPLDWAALGQAGPPMVGSAMTTTLALSQTLTVSGLQAGTRYYAQVAASDAGRQAAFSGELDFQTAPGGPLVMARQALRPVYHAAECTLPANRVAWLAGGLGVALAAGVGVVWARRRRMKNGENR